jgi:outer membrane protein assembly factor BamB
VAWNGATGENILWKAKIPRPGFNSPVVWGGRVYVSGADEEAREVYCFDAATGKLVWQQPTGKIRGSPRKLPEPEDDVGFAAATMATDGYRVFAIFGTGDVVCFDLAGKRVWARNLGVPDVSYGLASSLIVHEKVLIIQYDGKRSGRALGLDTRTGKTIWDKCRLVDPSWATPILVKVGDRMQAIMNAKPDVIGHDALTGEMLWRVRCMRGEVAPSPAYANGRVFVGVESTRLYGIQLGEKPASVWELKKDMPDISSPVAVGGFVFIANQAGGVFCVSATSGALVWEHEFDNGFHASPIVVGDRLYLLDEEGVMQILRVAGAYERIGSCPLGEAASSTLAVVDGRIYLRSPSFLYCIGEKKGKREN